MAITVVAGTQKNATISYLADGTIKAFTLTFPFISISDIVVRDNGVIKTIGTDYTIDVNPLTPVTGTPTYGTVNFVTAPVNAHTVKISRQTPQALVRKNPEYSHVEARQAFFIAQEQCDVPLQVPFQINQTDLLAPIVQDFVAPCDGYVYNIYTNIQVAITTGGTLTVKIGTTAVVGAVVTIANAATKGTVQNAYATAGDASQIVKRGDRVTITPASFATAGAVNGALEFIPLAA